MKKKNLMFEGINLSEAKIFSQCRVFVVNETPKEWRVNIIQCGVKFFHRDDTDYIDGPRQVYIPSGQRELFTDSTSKCVWQVYTAMKVQQEGFDPVTIEGRQNLDDPNKCIIETSFVLAPKQTVSIRELNLKQLSDFIEVRIM